MKINSTKYVVLKTGQTVLLNATVTAVTYAATPTVPEAKKLNAAAIISIAVIVVLVIIAIIIVIVWLNKKHSKLKEDTKPERTVDSWDEVQSRSIFFESHSGVPKSLGDFLLKFKGAKIAQQINSIKAKNVDISQFRLKMLAKKEEVFSKGRIQKTKTEGPMDSDEVLKMI